MRLDHGGLVGVVTRCENLKTKLGRPTPGANRLRSLASRVQMPCEWRIRHRGNSRRL